MLCLLCLQEKEDTFPIGADVQYNVPEIMEKHLDVKPLQMDREESEICAYCWGKLTDFHEYYQCVAEAQRTLSHKLETLESRKRRLFTTSEIEMKHDYEDFIKEEYSYDSPKNGISEDPMGTEDIFTGQLLELAASNDKTNIDIKCKNKKRTKIKKTPKRKRMKITEDSIENAESEDLKPLSLLLEDIKKETRYTDSTGSQQLENNSTINYNCGKHKFNATVKHRKGRLLLQENEDLIKKHIKMICQICPQSNDDFSGLVKHFKEQHADIKPHIKCCDRKLDSPSDILQHAYYHENPEHFKCTDCEKTFINNAGLKAHYMQYHEPEENLPHGCDQCPRRFSRRNLLEHHRSKHVPKTERSHYCEMCDPPRAFANEYILQIHIKNRHNKASNICHVCAKDIRDKQAFEKHVRLHFEKSGPRIKCPRDDCDRWLKDEDNLKQHLRRFHDARQYECPQCGRICKNKHALDGHLKSAHSTKSYICEACQKSFKSQQSLKEHMAGHTGEPLYNCPFCTRTFNSKANMYSHKKKAHPIEWENCNQSRIGSN